MQGDVNVTKKEELAIKALENFPEFNDVFKWMDEREYDKFISVDEYYNVAAHIFIKQVLDWEKQYLPERYSSPASRLWIKYIKRLIL
jgi:hypothetical protein